MEKIKLQKPSAFVSDHELNLYYAEASDYIINLNHYKLYQPNNIKECVQLDNSNSWVIVINNNGRISNRRRRPF